MVARHDYLPFGEEVAAGVGGRTTGQGYDGVDEVKQQFTGYERDAESGLDYAKARYFKPEHGRFTSVDPFTASAEKMNPQTLNRYTYALNSPYKFTDPLGLKPCSGASWDSWCDNSGDLGGGAILAESAARYEQNLQNTLAVSAVNRAVANGDQEAAEAICAANENVECQRSESSVTAEATVNSPAEEPIVGEQLPSFQTLWNNHPQNQPLPSQYENQCAIKLSYALLLSGVDMSSFRGATETITVNGKKVKVALRAYELWNWIEARYANQPNGYATIWTFPENGGNAIQNMQRGRGIVLLKDFWGAGQGHIDFWNGTNMAAGDGSWFDRSKVVILLDMTQVLNP